MCIYLNFKDLNQEKQEELLSLARDKARQKFSKKDASIEKMEYNEFIEEKADEELYNLSIIFNV